MLSVDGGETGLVSALDPSSRPPLPALRLDSAMSSSSEPSSGGSLAFGFRTTTAAAAFEDSSRSPRSGVSSLLTLDSERLRRRRWRRSLEPSTLAGEEDREGERGVDSAAAALLGSRGGR
ncbi:unnamed protein product [Ectocarpus fasciculatus]